MVKRGDPRVPQLVVMFFLDYSGLSQQALGERAGIDQKTISDYKLGLVTPSEKALRRLARAADVPWSAVVHLRRFYAALLSAISRRSAPAVAAEVALDAARLAVAPFFLEAGEVPPEEALAEAREIWAALEPLPMPRKKRLLGLAPRASRNWALAVEVSEASARAAAHKAGAALETAELALSIAERVPDERFRSRLLGWCRAFVANALRVATDFDGADAAFADAKELWRTGEGADPQSLLPEWRFLDLEASLRRAQRRFAEARKLLDRARALCGDDALIAGRILLNKEHVFDQMGDQESALAALAEAAPFIEAAQDSGQLFLYRFKQANNLCYLKRYEEAAALLPAVQEMAEKQGAALHQIRVLWLTARVAAGLGRWGEAEAGFQKVRREFEDRDLPYEAALVSLDLAMLWLEAGRTAEVRELAVEMEKVFKEKKIAREALAAVILFCQAARREAATVELTRRVMGEIEAARRG
jgi:transcriptional regulator with XRE-family HTH domain